MEIWIMKKTLLICGLAVVTVLSASHRVDAAFTTKDLILGPTYVPFSAVTLTSPGANNPLNNTFLVELDANEGGGSVNPSTLNGNALPFVYFVQIPVNVGVPGDYYATQVSSDGTIDPAPNANYPLLAGTVTVRNAGQIAWLLDNIGSPALTNDQQAGLQAALWLQVYGGAIFSLDPSGTAAGIYAAYLADLTLLNQFDLSGNGGLTANLSDVAWMTPATGTPPTGTNPSFDGLTYYQALVTDSGRPHSPSVPVPSGLVVWSLLGAIGVAVSWRRRSLLWT
jgi:hypothetical protein